MKDRDEYDPRDRDRLTDDARDDVADAFATIGVAAERADELGATLLTRYRRATLLAPDGCAPDFVSTIAVCGSANPCSSGSIHSSAVSTVARPQPSGARRVARR